MSDDDFEYVKESNSEPISAYGRQKIREQLQAEVEAFLAKGGTIQQVDKNLCADPPKRPDNNYSSRSI